MRPGARGRARARSGARARDHFANARDFPRAPATTGVQPGLPAQAPACAHARRHSLPHVRGRPDASPDTGGARGKFWANLN